MNTATNKSMKQSTRRRKTLLTLQTIALLLGALTGLAQDKPEVSPPSTGKSQPTVMSDNTVNRFDDLADNALLAMKKRAEELNIKGVAVIACSEGDTVQSWSSKMRVVGILKNPAADKEPGANLLAIAYSKASEMAETLKPSGNAGRPPMKGEVGWQGGVILKGKTGWLIAAFSGGRSEDDVKVSQAGVAVLATGL
jgi:uncharacterized protein GlcG (DUF336 family)